MKPDYKFFNQSYTKVVIQEKYSNAMLAVLADYDVTVPAIREIKYCVVMNLEDTSARWTSHPEFFGFDEIAVRTAERMLKKNLAMVKSLIARGKSHPYFEKMQASVKADVKHYQSDFLFHDLLTLGERHFDVKFIWCVREHGTEIYLYNSHSNQIQIEDAIQKQHAAVYFYDGHTLTGLHVDDIVDAIRQLPETMPEKIF